MRNLLLLSVFITLSGLAQGPSFCPQGDSLKLKGDLQGAMQAYQQAGIDTSTSKEAWYSYARIQALFGNKAYAFDALYKGIKGDTSVYPLTDPQLLSLIDDTRWMAFTDTIINRIELKFGAYKNLSLAKELWTMNMKDQAYYYHLSVAETQFEFGNAALKAIWDLKKVLNNENQTRLREIVSEFGWPKRSEVGGSAAQGAFLIVQHADIAYQQEFLPMMQEAAEKGEASWSSLAMLIDRVNMREGKSQVYGTQVICQTPADCSVYDVIDPEYLNQRRAEVGLSTIEEYIARWNIKWTVEQKVK